MKRDISATRSGYVLSLSEKVELSFEAKKEIVHNIVLEVIREVEAILEALDTYLKIQTETRLKPI
jgi:hypothetical protein